MPNVQLAIAAPAERARVKEQFVADLDRDLSGLLQLLRAKEEQLARGKRIDPAASEYCALEIIQFTRFHPAADLIVRLLDTRRTDFPIVSDESQTHFKFFPFAVAAVGIGVPSIPDLTRELGAAEVDTTRFQLSCLVLREILGEELALAQLAIAARADARLRDGQRQGQAALWFKKKPTEWKASLCADYTID
jgi:hypothetical protein